MLDQTTKTDPILAKLKNLVNRVTLLSPDFSEVDTRIYQHELNKNLYIIDVCKGRFTRTVHVDAKMVYHIKTGFTEPMLLREVRSAMAGVTRLAQEMEDLEDRNRRR
jgi:hypothetical protein